MARRDIQTDPYADPYRADEDEGRGYLSALNDQLAPEKTPGPSRPSLGGRVSSGGSATFDERVGSSRQPATDPQGPGSGSPRDQALGQIQRTYSAAAAPAQAAAAPVDLSALWNDYQAGRGDATQIRDALSMDDWDPEQFADLGDTGANHRRDAEELIRRGLARPEDLDAVIEEINRTNKFLYQPGQGPRSFAAGAPTNSYDINDTAQRAALDRASQLGHDLPDSTDLSRAGWQNVTQPMREQFRDQGFIPQAPESERYAQSGNPVPVPVTTVPNQPASTRPAPEPARRAPIMAPPAPLPRAVPGRVSTEPVRAPQPAPLSGPLPLPLQQLIGNATRDREAQQAQRGQLSQILMDQLGRVSGEVTPEDPTLAPILAAQRLASQRDADRSRAVAAERRAAQGLGDSGALETDIRGIAENQAERNQGQQAQTLYSELNNRRGAAQNLLGQAFQSNDAEAGRNISATLAALDQQMRGEQFGQGLGLDYARLNQQGEQFGQGLGLDYARLNQQGDQFGQGLGLDYLRLNQQGDQFDQTMAQGERFFDANLGYNYAGLNQNNAQFNANLGQQNNQFNAGREDRRYEFDRGSDDRRYEYDNTAGLNWAQLEQSGNLQALLALLGAA